MYDSYYGFQPYVPVAQRRAKAIAHAAKLAKKEKRVPAPVEVKRQIATSFWGLAWCEHLEKFSDFANRLPRGRTYVRNGSVVDLHIERGKIRAIVAGSEVYNIAIEIKTVAKAHWTKIKSDCTRSISSLMDLLQGRFDAGAMRRLTDREAGLFPQPREIAMRCSCPDSARLCKHLAAVLYGVGARLDQAPELLFTLRAVDHLELISAATDAGNLDQSLTGRAEVPIADAELGAIFGIDLDVKGAPPISTEEPARSKRGQRAAHAVSERGGIAKKKVTAKASRRSKARRSTTKAKRAKTSTAAR